MELYIVRHGKTEWNAAGRVQGHADIQLNEEGRAAAKALGKELKDTPLYAIYSSPLQRAKETAVLIRGDHKCPLIVDDRLIEISFGDLEGSTLDEWMNEDSPHRFFFSDPKKYVAPPNGESFESVCARTKDFMQKVIEPLAKEHEDARVLIVAHGALNKGLMCYLEGNDIAHYWGDGLQKNCQATVFSYKNGSWIRISS